MKNIGKFLLVFGVTVFLWFLAFGLYQHPTLPSPFAVMANLGAKLGDGLLVNLVYSCFRIFVATFFALLLGIPLGILLGYKESVHRWISPFLYFSYPVPKMALLPILMLLFGLGEISKILMIFLIIFFPVVLDTTAAVKNMDREPFQVLRAFGVSGKQICAKVIFPGLIPSIFNTLKVTTGIALSVLFFAENYGTTKGMGFYIMNSWQTMSYVDLYTGILVLSLLGFALFCLFDFIERKLTQWK